jgi:histidinol-phosphate phosphatase family protein
MYGDTMLNVDLERFWLAHQASGAAASLLLHPNDHPHDSDLVEVDAQNRIVAFLPYPHDSARFYANLVNAALYVFNRDALRPYANAVEYPDFGKHFFPFLLGRGVSLHGYRSPEYIKDAGTPERLDKVNEDYQAGRIGRGSLITPLPAVFLDRDGTLNRDVPYISKPEQLELLEGAAAAIRRLNQADVRVVVITNQPVVARGGCTEQELSEIHRKLETVLGSDGAYLDAIYYCPHHPHKGFAGERADLKVVCNCRKPATGLIDRAVNELHIDLSRSWFVGDTTVDLKTAANAGIRSILLRTGWGGSDARYTVCPEAVLSDLPAAVDFLLSDHRLEHP